MTREDCAFTLRVVLTSSDQGTLDALVRDAHPTDIAHGLTELEPGEATDLLGLMEPTIRARVFGYLPAPEQREIATVMGRDDLAVVLEEMDADDRADVYARLPDDLRAAVLTALSPPDRADVQALAGYPEDSAGALMTSEVARLRPDLTVDQAIGYLRDRAHEIETIYDAFVVDEEGRLLGTVTLRDLITSPPDRRLEDLARPSPAVARAHVPRAEAARLIQEYDVPALPVVDGSDRLLGIVTYDDAMDVVEAEATEDFLRSGGFGVAHHKGGPLTALGANLREVSTRVLVRKRLPWLIILVFGNIFSGAGIAYFEDTISAYVALVFFLPLLIDSGGNAGSQAATLFVRSLATGDVVLRDWLHMLGREIRVAILLGAGMGAAVSILGFVRGGPEIALVVTLTMVCVVLVGSVIGMSLPFILTRFKLDPATASAPLITSIADGAGVLIYFAIATALLPMPDVAVT